jgi:DNA invertase Pin-like site-specific DNA recombinase
MAQGSVFLERFKEQGESAKTADRTELQKLLQYCRTHKGKVQTRFAREKYDHFALRAHLKSLGISLRSATEPIDDTERASMVRKEPCRSLGAGTVRAPRVRGFCHWSLHEEGDPR